jgi:hypothetical protein
MTSCHAAALQTHQYNQESLPTAVNSAVTDRGLERQFVVIHVLIEPAAAWRRFPGGLGNLPRGQRAPAVASGHTNSRRAWRAPVSSLSSTSELCQTEADSARISISASKPSRLRDHRNRECTERRPPAGRPRARETPLTPSASMKPNTSRMPTPCRYFHYWVHYCWFGKVL